MTSPDDRIHPSHIPGVDVCARQICPCRSYRRRSGVREGRTLGGLVLEVFNRVSHAAERIPGANPARFEEPLVACMRLQLATPTEVKGQVHTVTLPTECSGDGRMLLAGSSPFSRCSTGDIAVRPACERQGEGTTWMGHLLPCVVHA